MAVISIFGGEGTNPSGLIDALAAQGGRAPRRPPDRSLRAVSVEVGAKSTTTVLDLSNEAPDSDNSLTALTEATAVVLFVSASRGWLPYLTEIVDMSQLIGLDTAAVVITTDPTDQPGMLPKTKDSVAAALSDTTFSQCPIVAIEAFVQKPALESFSNLLFDLCESEVNTPATSGPARMWVQMAYTVGQAGTVVTGVVDCGTFCVSDPVVISPGSLKGSVRGLQTNKGMQVDVGHHQFVAVNLNDVDYRDISRGNALISAKGWQLTTSAECSLMAAHNLSQRLASSAAYRVHVGLSSHSVRVKVLSENSLAADDLGSARLDFPVALPLQASDRFFVRDTESNQVVAGGFITETTPEFVQEPLALPGSNLLSQRGWIDVEEFARLTGVHQRATVGHWVVDPAALESMQSLLRRLLAQAGAKGLDVSALTDKERAVLRTMAGIEITGNRAHALDLVDLPAIEARTHPYLKELRDHPFDPPQPEHSGLERREARLLVDQGVAIETNGYFFATEAAEVARTKAMELLKAEPHGIDASDLAAELRRNSQQITRADSRESTAMDEPLESRTRKLLSRMSKDKRLEPATSTKQLEASGAKVIDITQRTAKRERIEAPSIEDGHGHDAPNEYEKALLQHLDRAGVIRQRHDTLVAGPKIEETLLPEQPKRTEKEISKKKDSLQL